MENIENVNIEEFNKLKSIVKVLEEKNEELVKVNTELVEKITKKKNKANKEKLKVYQKKYNEGHKDKILEIKKKYYLNNAEKIKKNILLKKLNFYNHKAKEETLKKYGIKKNEETGKYE